MKTLRRFSATLVLTLALALAAFAGDMSTSVVSPPPPASQMTAQGDMSTSLTGDMSTSITTTDPATDIFNLLQSLLSLF
jgi:hypothetical protein